MNVLIINGSAKGKNSETFKIAQTFVAGLGEKAKVIETYNSKIKPCKSCFKCQKNKKNKCTIKDDTQKIIKKIKNADLVIWSSPLFCYSVPSTLKALLDRLTSLSSKTIIVDDDGETTHPIIDTFGAKHVLISGSPLPDRENSFDAIKFQFTHMFGKDIEMILCTEKTIFHIASAQAIAQHYLKIIERAGRDYKHFGHILKETHQLLSQPMLPEDMYINSVNQTPIDE